MGANGGPIPKREDERRRVNKTTEAGVPLAAQKVDIPDGPEVGMDPNSLPFKIAQPVIVPVFDGDWRPADDREEDDCSQLHGRAHRRGWHPLARAWYDSLSSSGQAIFYEPSDWTVAALIAESMSRDLDPQFVGMRQVSEDGRQEPVFEVIPIKGASLNAYLKGMSVLMATEGDRRRMRLELNRKHADGTEGTAKVISMTGHREALLAGS